MQAIGEETPINYMTGNAARPTWDIDENTAWPFHYVPSSGDVIIFIRLAESHERKPNPNHGCYRFPNIFHSLVIVFWLILQRQEAPVAGIGFTVNQKEI